MSGCGAIRQALHVLGLGVVLLLPVSPLTAQTMTNSFGGMSKNSDAPIDIQSDLLTVYDTKKIAIFKGNVKAVQGTTTLRATQLDVHYIGGAEELTGKGADQDNATTPVAQQGATQKDADPQSSINKLEARGDVYITSEDDQTTSSDWAVYDVPAQLVTVGGNVVLSQGQNVLKGNRLIIDLKTGESRFDNTGNAAAGGGRIRALFMPKGSDVKDSAAAMEPEPGQAQQVPGAQVPGAAVETGEPLPIAPPRR
ncbi:MAG: LptA/OstA family protein [Alphaproteobacteria bacterium]|jgi:lipopolysaccharide export system protein LptA|uniref:LptA/OstA family protein n=1 Tax=Methyloceanibacter sp. TaxID=1965321 RepID=UPI00356B2490